MHHYDSKEAYDARIESIVNEHETLIRESHHDIAKEIAIGLVADLTLFGEGKVTMQSVTSVWGQPLRINGRDIPPLCPSVPIQYSEKTVKMGDRRSETFEGVAIELVAQDLRDAVDD